MCVRCDTCSHTQLLEESENIRSGRCLHVANVDRISVATRQPYSANRYGKILRYHLSEIPQRAPWAHYGYHRKSCVVGFNWSSHFERG